MGDWFEKVTIGETLDREMGIEALGLASITAD